MNNNFDIIVLGAGPGGYVAAIRAAQLGAKVALIEKDKVGGACLNRGCIPTKALIACTSLYEKLLKAENFGITAKEVSLNAEKIFARKQEIVNKIVKNLENLILKNKVEIIYGKGKVLESGKVEIEKVDSGNPCLPAGRLIVESRKLILATGSSPTPLPNLNFDSDKVLSSDDLLNYHGIPEKLNIVGGGVIGIHFATLYSTLGSQVTVYEALPEILNGIDEEVVALAKRILKRKKVEILTNTRFDPAQAQGEKTLICVGRTPNSLDGKSVWINERMETSIPNVYAIGDLVSQKMLAHVAYEQGVIAAENALGGNKTFSYDFVPIGIYTTPEIGAIGLTEKEAREKHPDIKVGKFPFAALGIAQAMGEIEGFIKVINNEAGKILGVHIIGPEATTLIGIAAAAMKNDLKVEQLADVFQSHPSYSEGLQEATLGAIKKAIHIF